MPLIKATWFIDDYWYFYYLSPFGDILKEGETPYEHGSHPYIFKAYPFIDGEIHSFVADVIDQQRYTNRLITLFGIAGNSGGGFGFGLLIGFAAIIADIWFSLAQYVKRLHDTDKSGWWILLFLIPIVNIVLALYMLFADGTVGPNRYGLDPKNRMPYNASINVNVNVNTEKPTTASSEKSSEF